MKFLTVILLSLLIIKSVNAQLQAEWSNTYNGTGGIYDHSVDFTIDTFNNTIVVSRSFDSASSSYNAVLIKYDAGGQQLWTTTYSNTLYKNETPYNVVTDAAGNIYLFGVASDSAFLFKHHPSGNIIWEKHFKYGDAYIGYASRMTISDQGNLFFSGWKGDSFSTDSLFISKVDLDGALMWRRSIPSEYFCLEYTWEMKTDLEENVYLAGITNYYYNPFYPPTFSGGDAFVLKIQNNGTFDWKKIFDSGDSSYETSISMVIDEQKNIYISAHKLKSNYSDLLLLKYDQFGFLLWVDSLEGGSQSFDTENDLLVLHHDKIFLMGNSPGLNGITNVLNASYDLNGNLLWKLVHVPDTTLGLTASSGTNLLFGNDGLLYTLIVDRYNWKTKTLFEVRDTAGVLSNSYPLISFCPDTISPLRFKKDLDGSFILYGQTDGPNNCSDIITCKLTLATGIQNLDWSEKSWMLFPNPTTSRLTISLPSTSQYHLIIINLLGEVMSDQTVYGNELTVDVASLSTGVYLAVVKNDVGTVVKKFVKE